MARGDLSPALRIAIVKDFLPVMRGAEKVLEAWCGIWPDADLYSLFHVKGAVSPVIERHPDAAEATRLSPQPEAGSGLWAQGSGQVPPAHTGSRPAMVHRAGPKVGRNDPCHCGSGVKFKKGHGK